MTLTKEQRAKSFERVQNKTTQLDNFINTYLSEYNFTRETGITLITENFFTSEYEQSIRNIEGFKNYYYSMEPEHRNRLHALFNCMAKNICFDLEFLDHHKQWLEIFIHRDLYENPYYFEIEYNESLYILLKSYLYKHLNINTTVEQLLLHIQEKEMDQELSA